MNGGEHEERLEGGHRGAASVEAEGELVEVDLEMGVADAVVGPDEPSLEVPEDPVNARQQLLRAVRRSLKAGPVAGAERAQRGGALPGVGGDARPGGDHRAHEPRQGAGPPDPPRPGPRAALQPPPGAPPPPPPAGWRVVAGRPAPRRRARRCRFHRPPPGLSRALGRGAPWPGAACGGSPTRSHSERSRAGVAVGAPTAPAYGLRRGTRPRT